ncbi:MAG TPA: hypothetical protein QF606_01010 [Anaerolineales bacterium]|nr:hypothetical protein [Anaerolineaceae bacterium]HJO90227.1 hypothetical protein [Anaerolineales bacterium]
MNRSHLRINQFIGIVIGLVGTLMTANFWPEIRNTIGGWGGAILWGVALGGIFGSVGHLNTIGKFVTKSNNRLINSIVGLLLPFATIAILLILMNIDVFS